MNRAKNQLASSEGIRNLGQTSNPQNAEAYYKQGFVYQKQGQSDQAIENFDKAIRIDPQFARAYSNRGFAYLNKEQYKLAIADCTKAIKLNASDTVARLNRGVAYRLQGDKARAIADFEKVINSSDNPQEIKIAKQQIKELSKPTNLQNAG